MKTKILTVSSVGLLLSVALFSVASAKEIDMSNFFADNTNIKVQVEDGTTSSSEKTKENNKSTSTDIIKNDNATNTNLNEDNNNRATSTNEETNSDLHRGVVSSFVQSLLNVANREGGIGEQVRKIAKEQNDSIATTTFAMTKVEERGSFRAFLFGADYKNLGVIRSELATTTNNIAQLKALLDKTTSVIDRNDLNSQIKVLENEQTKINAYISAHENIFSLFGWFNKLFVK